ncbi:hypothetical protein [Akkermansia muciniphila]|uniref:hypothetical protein n=1 Tax=Akkermansia muciniphila TaxID=239935 RepID=UPI001C060502|nr:hypothetical protein [Akkermansia muciniphila]QWP59143.1 hypothetical protein J5W45_03955 [Akkermansia muciniphila]
MFIGGSGGPWRGRGGNASDTPVGQGTPLVIGTPPDIFNIGISGWSKEQKKKEENGKKNGAGTWLAGETMTRRTSRRRTDCLGNHTGY